ncbi:MAG: hypothetical protein ACRCXC_11330 [Legionella sp.]
MGKSLFRSNSDKYGFVVDVGIGPNFIQTSHYNEVALTTYTIPDNAFSPKTNTAFAATVGAGIQWNYGVGKIPLECGYRFFYLGQGELQRIMIFL